MQNQKDGTQIAPSRSPLKDLSICGEVGASLRSVTDMGSPMRISPLFFGLRIILMDDLHRQDGIIAMDMSTSFKVNDLPITLTGKLDGGALKGAADCGGMLQSDWNNKRGN